MEQRNEPHMIFHLVEILEQILLETDARTLLTSTQLVCYKWHELIKRPPRIQTTLFFNPSKNPHQSSTKNPFIREIIGKFTTLTAEPCLLRPGASWRRMLPQQPPVSFIKIRHAHSENQDDVVEIMPVEELRMQHLADAMGSYEARVLYGIRKFSSTLLHRPVNPVILLNDGSVLDANENYGLLVYDPVYIPRQCSWVEGEPTSVVDMMFNLLEGCHSTVKRDHRQW
ncbi:hypothetical protein BDV38DRAFT_280322 [Aspergillus pseudotamarii]|uniref:F-box domain-containing protein n=1 Tax=Aspergillus pseudotamarii TaxID=132259 RepID=A0A5N6T213_ASPPS|nr:uncharacterized protein BDV38DRAFT_280322 [Aspergillus pseudotamarii]KAE8140328.1 hypothetical protein BDV38DRAFT_280322 [Aspergillus pseudotamarii]